MRDFYFINNTDLVFKEKRFEGIFKDNYDDFLVLNCKKSQKLKFVQIFVDFPKI